MSKAICTITTLSHLPQSLALAASVQQCFTNVQVHIFSVDKKKDTVAGVLPRNVYLHFFQDDYLNGLFAPYYKKHRGNTDQLRWSLKPVVMEYLLTEKKCDEVLYADNDLFFFSPAPSNLQTTATLSTFFEKSSVFTQTRQNIQ